MILTKKSSAWILVGLQATFSFFFLQHLTQSFSLEFFDLFHGPLSLKVLSSLLVGLTGLLALTALWKFEIALIFLLFAIHIVCPLIFFTYLTRNPYFTQIVLLNVWIAFFWIVWAWECWKKNRISFPKTVLDLPLLLFLIFVFISLLISFITHDSSFHFSMVFEGTRSILFLILNCFLVFFMGNMVEETWRKRFIQTTFFVGAVASLYGLLQYFGIEQIWKTQINPFGNRPLSTFGNPNFLSSYLLMLAPLLFTQFLVFKNLKKSLGISLIFFIFMACIIATMTRSTWVGVLLSFSVLILLMPIRELVRLNIKKLVLLFLILVAGIVLWPKSRLGGYSGPLERILEIKNVKNPQGYQPWHQRILIWSSSWGMVKDHPYFGKGWGLFELFYPYYQGKMIFSPQLKTFRTHANNAHNELMEIWSQCGILGTGLYIWIWVIIFIFGIHLARGPTQISDESRILACSLFAGAFGMLTDNFFGNVSLHFAVPAFLFWWQLGILFGLGRSENYTVSLSTPRKFYLLGIVLFLGGTIFWNFNREFQEIYYFNGFKVARDMRQQDFARKDLEKAWEYYSKEVNTNYELANTYARLSQIMIKEGLQEQAQNYVKKALWAYIESNRSNSGYDEIHFNLAATLAQLNIIEEPQENLKVLNPLGQPTFLEAKDLLGAKYYFSRALLLNPLSKDAYQFLGNIYLLDMARNKEPAIALFSQALHFFPEDQDFQMKLEFARNFK